MFKTCDCGQMMKLELRKLIHERKTRICHVPVYACQACKKYELLPLIKSELLRYLSSPGHEPRRTRVSFADINESAYVLREAFRTYEGDSVAELQARCMEVFDERVNMLLDLFSYAQNLGDDDWMRQIEGRLEQLSSIKSLIPENSGNYSR